MNDDTNSPRAGEPVDGNLSPGERWAAADAKLREALQVLAGVDWQAVSLDEFQVALHSASRGWTISTEQHRRNGERARSVARFLRAVAGE